jgi:hypothetical protein
MNYPNFWEGKGKGICEIQKFPTHFSVKNSELERIKKKSKVKSVKLKSDKPYPDSLSNFKLLKLLTCNF